MKKKNAMTLKEKKENNNNIKTTKFTKFVRNLKGFFLKKKKIISKKKNENDINESNFFKIMKDMMVLSLKREDLLKYFKKDRALRAEIETETVADFLSADKKNIFFNSIRKISKGKLYTLVQSLTLDYYKKEDLIFLYKEPMNKFCIIFEGTISLYLPYFLKKNMTIKEFLNYFFYTKTNFPKSFSRVEKKNEYLFDGIYKLKVNEYNINCLSDVDEMKKQDFYIEEYQNVYDIYEGDQINQISILYNLVQNFNAYAKTDVYILSLNRNDFMHILRGSLEDELSKEFGKLRKYCYIFNLWSNYSLAQIMNYYIPFKLINEELVYKQKDESDSFYIINDGIFDVYCEISLSEFSQYKKYLYANNQNVIEWIKEEKEKKNKISIEKIIDYIQWKIKKEEYPEEKEMEDKNIVYIKKNMLNKGEENNEKLINLKVNEDILKEKNKKIKIKLFTLQKNDFIGLEDSLELKSRYYTVQCVSEKGILNKIRILDFIVFIASNHGLELENIINYVKERKNNIIERIHNNLYRVLNNSKRSITNAYSIALSSYEKRKKLAVKIKTDSIHNINYKNNLNLNDNLIQKIQQFNQKNNRLNTFIQYKDINLKRKKSAGIRRTYLVNQLFNEEKKASTNKFKWNFIEENEKSNLREKNRKNAQTNISSYILTTSNTDRKSKKNKISKNSNNINKVYYFNNITYSKSNHNSYKKFSNYNYTTTTLYDKNYDILLSKDIPYNTQLDKEIINMTGIYNTKREVLKKQLLKSPPKESKYHIQNNKLSHSNFIRRKMPYLALLSNRNLTGKRNVKNYKAKI